MCAVVSRRLYEARYAHLACQFVEHVTLHELAPGVCQETFTLTLEVAVHNIAHYSVEHRVAEKLEPLVVQRLSLVVAPGYALVHESQLVVFYVVGVEPHDVIKGRKKLLLLAERELNPVYDIVIQHTS